MFNIDAAALIDRIRRQQSMSEADLLDLRRAFGADLEIDSSEADILFELNGLSDLPEGWAPYFTSILANYVIDQMEPRSYLHEANAAWLMARIDHDGVVETDTELMLLVNVLRQARHVPPRFSAYVLHQVRSAVIDGRGAVRGKMLQPGVIGEEEVDLLRRALYAGGGSDGIGICKEEAEVLQDLNEATTGRDNHPAWRDLYVKGIANYLMMMRPPSAPSAAEAKRREDFLSSQKQEATEGRAREWFSFDFRGAFEALGSNKESVTRANRSYVMDHNAQMSAERITSGEAVWLMERLNRDGVLNENEQALLEFIARESPDMDAALRPFLKSA